MKAKSNTVDAAEVENFSRLAGQWWDPHGAFAPLHRINPLRIGYIRDHIVNHFGAMAGRTLLDIGCGGGLVCEPMARLGAQVTGIDASEKNIAVAKLHAEQSALNIDYQCTTAEELGSRVEGRESGKENSSSPLAPHPSPLFDVVLALEIVEHVADVSMFVDATCKLVKPGGLIVYSTLNRTLKSFALAIVGAEYVLRWLPRGTHQWEKFLRPSELCNELRRNGITIQEMTGMVLNPVSWKWELNPKDLGVNYLVVGKK